ncbi:unannotated protein [freshwater metagenome]|uniref:Unannotated protein n=1 Tax=freshwater metagenome TaxID=449393 RepID=A0A6J7JFG7_9ZZZZ
MARAQKRTRYLIHLDLAHNHRVLSHLHQELRLRRWGHTKLECDVPTRVGARCTNRACCRPIQNNVAQALLVQSLLDHRALHLQRLLQVVQLSQTIAAINVVQQLLCTVSNVQRSECMAASLQQLDPSDATLQLQQRALRSDPCHRIVCRCPP